MRMRHLLLVVMTLGMSMALSFGFNAIADESESHVQTSGEKCVEPTDVIRRMHGTFLKHQRNDTMHRGIRTKKHSLVECINCHVEKDEEGNYPHISSPKHFCQGCHTYAAVNLDCFQCHATKPDESPLFNMTSMDTMSAMDDVEAATMDSMTSMNGMESMNPASISSTP